MSVRQEHIDRIQTDFVTTLLHAFQLSLSNSYQTVQIVEAWHDSMTIEYSHVFTEYIDGEMTKTPTTTTITVVTS